MASAQSIHGEVGRATRSWCTGRLSVLAVVFAAGCGDATGPGNARRISELTAVTAGPDRFVAVGTTFWATDVIVASSDTALIASSTDGLTWETAVTAEAGTLLGVAHGNGRFVAVGSRFDTGVGQTSFRGVVYVSDEGRVWTAVPDSTSRSWRSVSWGGGQFVAAGYDPTTQGSVIATSPDGVTWTDRAVADIASPGTAFGGGTFVLWGEAGAVAISTDAIDWTVVPVDSVHWITGMVYLGGRFLASGVYDCCFGEVAGGATSFDLSSTDGASWTVRRRSDPEGLFTGYAFGAGRYVALGGRDVFTSSDGTTWHQAVRFSEHHNGIAYRNGRFVVVGRNVLTSPDGEAWAAAGFPAPSALSRASEKRYIE
jgi:hypothetical protein